MLKKVISSFLVLLSVLLLFSVFPVLAASTNAASTNLLLNSSFENVVGSAGVADNWVPANETSESNPFQVVDSPVADGLLAQKISATAIPDGSKVAVYQILRVEPNKPFTLKGKFKIDHLSNADVQLVVDFSNQNDGWKSAGPSVVKSTHQTTNGYVPLEISGTTTSTTTHVWVYAIIRATGGEGAGTFYVDNMQYIDAINGCSSNIAGVTPPEGTIASASTFHPSAPATNAIDNCVQTPWNASNYFGTLQLDFPHAVKISGIQLFVHSSPDTTESYTIYGFKSGQWIQISTTETRKVINRTIVPIDPIMVETGEYTGIKVVVDGGLSWVAIHELLIIE